ncbi:nuclear exosome regulator NRDE2 isoform X1 [Dromiciops gliroides]|uniref:nuclear exosome regulator NRDE2 isoform X1 n=1 Tax=Dromiciops gliroides TaxID=33562 RepID=UPI001CC7B70E|nr:nuclear exosome regulator NRDE2 isoform X1 [Dromiciops gliroides]
MALFPAFAGVSAAPESSAGGSSRKDLDWLSNPSFCTGSIPALQQNTVEIAALTSEKELITRSPLRPELSEGSDTYKKLKQASRKKKKEKKRKKKHQHHKKTKKKYEQSSDSESYSATDSEKETSTGGIIDSKKEVEKTNSQENNAIDNSGSRFVWLDDIQALTTETFRTDKKPDPANWEYKSLYRGDIARYKRKGNSCLGINPKKQRISWEGTSTEKKQLHKKFERYFSKKSVRSVSIDGVAICSAAEVFLPDPSPFIPVKDSDDEVPPSTSTWVNPLGVYDKSTTLWLQGQGPSDQETKQPVSQKDSEDAILKAKVEEFNRKVRENPRDIQLWLEFVSFQDEVMKGPSLYTISEGEQESRRKSLKLILEKKLSILDRAIESNQNSVELKLARLKLCTEFWEPSTLIKEWQKLIFLHPNNTALWQKYLLFCQSQFSTFTVSKIHNLYGKCLSTLAAVQDGSILSHPALPGTEEAMFALFLQQCHFLRQAGHTEKAISLFQAMIDFTFFKPDSVKDLPTRGQVEFFEPFWDSGEPRVGEKGARGWRAWMHQQERGGWVVVKPDEDEDEPEEDDQEIKNKTLPKWQIWLSVERSREQRHWLPWRPDKTKKQTDEDCEDPERQVLFDDLGLSLIKLSNPDLKFQLIDAFLQFLGVPSGCNLPTSCLYLAMDENGIFDDGLSDEKPLTFSNPSFSGVNCVGHMDQMDRQGQRMGHCKEGEEFIQNIFHLVLPLFSGKEKSHLCLSWLQYEIAKVTWYLQTKNKKRLKTQGKKCKKLAKNLLKEPENRNNFCLWKEYARLEWLLGNTEDARKVFDTAISMAGPQDLSSRLYDLSLLYAELEVELSGNMEGSATSRAIHILTKLTENGPYIPYTGQVLPVNILKARKAYEHTLQKHLNESPASDPSPVNCSGYLISLVGCFMLFQYLTIGVNAAMHVYKQVFDKLKGAISSEFTGTGANIGAQNLTNTLEAVTLMHTNLLRYHMKVSVFPLNPLREALSEALKLYPGNQVLWRSYVQIQNKSHNASKTRRFFDVIMRSAESLEPRLFAIQAEKMRKRLVEAVLRVDAGEIHSTIPETGLSNRIKALFENAIQSDNGSNCPLLWRMYLNFLVSLGNKERSKGVFYRALQHCPWAKVLYMDAVDYFPDQIQEILDLMTEKELRVRVPIEELELLLED